MKPSFASVGEAFGYLESFTNFEKKAFSLRNFRLDRMHRLLEIFDNPQHSFKCFHIAGSKGKGSTAAFLASVLKTWGRRAGLYTSPHLVSYKERITLAGDEIEDGVFLRGIEAIRGALDNLEPAHFPGGDYPTTFELLTCLGFLVFRELGCDWAVLETGMGGRLDATNVAAPSASLLTPIELEHTEYLGDTLAEIAEEKAGIIKPGVPVFASPQNGEALRVFQEHARRKNCPFFYLPDALENIDCRTTLDGTLVRLAWKADSPAPDGAAADSIFLRLLGEVQAENAALAALTIRRTLPEIPGDVLIRGLENAYIPGRFQRVEDEPPVYVDGSHTPLSVGRLLHSFMQLYPRPDTLVLGIVAGKRYREIADILCPNFRRVIVTTPGTFKASEPEKVFDICRAVNPDTRFLPDPATALAEAKRGLAEPEGSILVTGSFYLAGEILRLYPST